MMQGMKYVYEVYKEKSFTGAAKKLFISQPSLSAAIKKVEKELGVLLFDRGSFPVRLTDAGIAYIEAMEAILAIENNLTRKLNDLSQLKTGSLTIGGSNFVSSYILSKAVAAFSGQYPGITVHWVESNSNTLHSQVLSESVDLLIDSFEFDKSLYTSYTLFEEHILLSVPRDHPVNQKLGGFLLTHEEIRDQCHLDGTRPAVDLKNFRDESFILLKKGNDMHFRALSLCEANGFEPNVAIYLDQLTTSYNTSQNGMGITFVTDTIVNFTGTNNNVVFYKLDGDICTRPLCIAHKKNRYISSAMEKFILTAREKSSFP